MAAATDLIALEPFQVRELFPALIGEVFGGLQVSDGVFVINQGAGAHTIMVNGIFHACCPSARRALQAARRITAVNP